MVSKKDWLPLSRCEVLIRARARAIAKTASYRFRPLFKLILSHLSLCAVSFPCHCHPQPISLKWRLTFR